MLANAVMVWREIFFTCGGCGGETERGVDYRTSSLASSPAAVAVMSERCDCSEEEGVGCVCVWGGGVTAE